MSLKHSIQLLVGCALAVFFGWLVFRQIDPASVWAAIRGASPSWVLAGVVVFFLGYSCRIERWREMLMNDNPALAWVDCAGPMFASVAANNVLPFRAGDVVRAFAFNRRLGISTSVALTTLVVERLLDLVVILIFFTIALVALGGATTEKLRYASLVPVLGAATLLALLLFPENFERVAASGVRLVRRFAPGLGARLALELHKVVVTLEHVGSRRTMARLVLLSVLTWLFEGLVFLCAAKALPAVAQPLGAWLALPVGTLATLIPSTPGFVGTFDYFVVQAMTELGNSENAAAAFAVLVHILLWLPPTVTGGLYALIHPLKGALKARRT
ncbi:lysylphosphatidylglycerol synthase transmembrane domain-containing protein [uncultured Rhodoblastus sp.]|uniref:lysylphosphatidylglycerol synthase transmembrane domain-containing protein n=1 Tax=uncultured Rhodoblastus sp. TaxID=543037 RepID=UPI0025DF3C0E|nr:lysylphosphatidylglycerol synthase transmembrane domain-containing protein [uncultured Rhodoblastus sp.]